MEIQPKIQPYADALNKKLVNSPFINELDHKNILLTCVLLKKILSFFAKKIFRLQAELAVYATAIWNDHRQDDG